MKKYKLRLDLKLYFNGRTLYKIERLSDNVLGGYIEKEENLSQEGTSWVSGDALVSGDAHVSGNAQVYGKAWICDNAWIYGNAHVYDNARVYGDAQVCGEVRVYSNAEVGGNAHITKKDQIVNIIIPYKYSITITPDNIVIGCQVKKRTEWLKVTKEQAIDMGLSSELYDSYRSLIKSGMKLVPSRSKIEGLEGLRVGNADASRIPYYGTCSAPGWNLVVPLGK